jgi:hypothetical protein
MAFPTAALGIAWRYCFVVLALLFASPDTASAQDRVGVTAAVNPDANSKPPGAPIRRLVIGQEVIFNERIITSQTGQTQLLFLDASAMTVGPNSDLTIDEFVYDPRSGAGKLAMSTTRGVMRFVGGKLSKQEPGVVVRSPAATLAVRGGVFLLDQAPNGQLEAIFIYGRSLSITGATGASETLSRPGYSVTIAAPGAAPSKPFPVAPGRIATLLSLLDGRSGGSGGASVIPTDQMVAASDRTYTGDLPVNVQQMGYGFGAPFDPSVYQRQITGSIAGTVATAQTMTSSFTPTAPFVPVPVPAAPNPALPVSPLPSTAAGAIGPVSASPSLPAPGPVVSVPSAPSSPTSGPVVSVPSAPSSPAAGSVAPIPSSPSAPTAGPLTPVPPSTPVGGPPPVYPSPLTPPAHGRGPFGHGSGPFGHGSGPFGHGSGPFGHGSGPFGHGSGPFGHASGPSGHPASGPR